MEIKEIKNNISNILGVKCEDTINPSKYVEVLKTIKTIKESKEFDVNIKGVFGATFYVDGKIFTINFKKKRSYGDNNYNIDNIENIKSEILKDIEKDILRKEKYIIELEDKLKTLEEYREYDMFLGYGEKGINKAKELGVDYYGAYTYGDDRFEYGGSEDIEIYTTELKRKDKNPKWEDCEMRLRNAKHFLKCLKEEYEEFKYDKDCIKVEISYWGKM